MTMPLRYAALLLFGFACLGLSVSLPAAEETTSPAEPPPFAAVGDDRLHNAHIVTGKVISGAQPEGEAGFAALKALGVKTIISVDGAKPDLALAGKYGMRYVHLPIGYDGVAVEDGKAIAKAISSLPGPIYLHCHHGKHRSAAAVAVACVYNGTLEPHRAEAVLKTFGTGANYKGLWRAALEARRVDSKELADLQVEFVEVATIPDLAARMVELDRHWEHVKQIKAAGWTSPTDHPDLDPAHEVLQVQEHLTESARLESAQARPTEFREMIHTSATAAESLREALTARPVDPVVASRAFEAVAQSCVSCHTRYRD